MSWLRLLRSIPSSLAAVMTAIVTLGVVTGAYAAKNLLVNEGFESPPIGASSESDSNPSDWIVFSSVNGGEKIGLSATLERTGKQGARFRSQGVIGSYQGLCQMVPASPGVPYTFSVYVRNDKADPLQGPSMGQLAIEWHDARDQEIARTYGPTWGVSLFSAHWVKFDVTEKAPPNTARARVVIVQADGKTAGGGGSFGIDDASWTESR